MEFALSSIVLLLLAMGLLDLSRAFYFGVSIQGAAREGARHAAWFDTPSRLNTYLSDNEVITTVNQALAGSGMTGTFRAQPNCLAGTDGNTQNNPPYPSSAYPGTYNAPNVYACYTRGSDGYQTGSLLSRPANNDWRLGDVNVQILLSYGLITGFMQNVIGNFIQIPVNAHFTIQGRP
ncbi:MAG TPA: TadE/TadG family type IV pilus assembly protein [Candidatus Acidoferrales bacterium]|nr:TadE/TadG family type IV pilus assembly protein [Candidatus Acidoferrales bacterium]